MASVEFLWLAGVLEGEGSFLSPPPSSSNSPIVSCRMTDRDVIERVATMFGVTVGVTDKGKHRTEYRATLKGTAAVALMRDLRPLMGIRRRSAIDRAIGGHQPCPCRLSFRSSEEIRRLGERGQSVSELARHFGVSRPTIRAVLHSRIHRAPPRRPWTAVTGVVPDGLVAPPNVLLVELYWLAGWLEGEASFSAPSPSDPRRPRISGQSRDVDVIGKVARILGVSAVARHGRRARERGWSPMYEALKRGRAAAELMRAIEPAMGARRQAQIRRALAQSPATIGNNTGAKQLRRGVDRPDVASRGSGLAS